MADTGKTEIKKYSVTVKTVVEGLGELNKLLKVLEKIEKKLKSFADHIWKVNQAFQAMKTGVDNARKSIDSLQDALKAAGVNAGNLARRLTGVARAYGGILTAQGKLGRIKGRTGGGGAGGGSVINASAGAIVNVYNGGGGPGGGGPGTPGTPGGRKRKGPSHEKGAAEAEATLFGRAALQSKELAKSTMFLIRSFRALAIVAGAMAALLPAKQFSDSARDVTRKSSYLGLSKGSYQQYDAIFQQFGAGEGDLEDFFGTLADRMKDVADGTGYVEDFKNMLGVTGKMLKNVDGSLKSSDELLEIFFAGVKRNATATERLAAVVRVLGDDVGRKLGPLIALGIDNLADLKKEVYDLGLVFSDAELEIGNKFSWSLARLGMMAEGLWKRLGLNLTPAFQKFADVLDYLGRTDIPWLNQHLEDMGRKWDRVATSIASAVRSIDDLLKAGGMQGGLVQSITQLTEAAGAMLAVGAVIGAIFYPAIIGAAAAIAALWLAMEDFMIWGQGGESWIDWELMATGMNMLWASVTDLFSAFSELFKVFTGIEEGNQLQAVAQWFIDLLGTLQGILAVVTSLITAMVRLAAVTVDDVKSFFGGGSQIVSDKNLAEGGYAKTAQQGAYIGQGFYGLNAAMAGENAREAARNHYGGRNSGNAAPVYNINNNVNVSGTSDPGDTAERITDLLPTSEL